MFDRHFTWDAHVSDVVRSCVGLLVGLRHLRNFLPRLVMLAVVRALVISRVNYCLSVYGNSSTTNEARLMKVINFATRVVTGLRRFDHVSRARSALGLCAPRQMHDSRAAIVGHRVRMLGEHEELASLFCTFAESRHCDRTTRQDRYLRPPTTKAAAGQRSFSYRAASLLKPDARWCEAAESYSFSASSENFCFSIGDRHICSYHCVRVCACVVFLCASIWHFTIPPVTNRFTLWTIDT